MKTAKKLFFLQEEIIISCTGAEKYVLFLVDMKSLVEFYNIRFLLTKKVNIFLSQIQGTFLIRMKLEK